MAYTGSVELISGIKTKNGGTYPLMDAKDVRVTDDERLDEALRRLQAGGGGGSGSGYTYSVDENGVLYITSTSGQSISVEGENIILP